MEERRERQEDAGTTAIVLFMNIKTKLSGNTTNILFFSCDLIFFKNNHNFSI